jgi:Ca2+/Na+ antiporter
MLHALQPFHSLLLVTTVQHVMGIGLGTIIYVVLRTRGLPAWGAVLAAAPTLFDSRQIWLESSILPDTLFTLTLMIAVAILIVRPKPAIWQAAIVGLLVSYASVIRGNGAPVFVVILIFMLIMRVGWKAFAACVAAFVVPLAVYVMIFFSDHNQLNITDSTGLFLWSRTMSFANCSIIKPPANLVPLCPQNQPGHPVTSAPAWSVPALLGERTPADYLWDAGAWYRVDAHPGVNAYNNKLAMQFAERAILAQPGAYLKTVGKEVLETFFTTDRPTDYLAMQFTVTPHVNPEVAYMAYWENRYAYTKENTHLHQPWAYLMFLYQEPVWFPGAVFFAVMVGGLVMLIRRWRRGLGRLAFLAWGVAIVNLVLPIAAHELDYRYAISAVPFACLALGLTFVRKPVASGASGASGTSGTSAAVASGTGASVEVTPGVEADAAD